MPGDDHDKLIEIASDIKYIRMKFEDNCKRLENAETKISRLEKTEAAAYGCIALLAAFVGWGLLKLP